MNNSGFDIIIIGAGHAGLCVSYYLSKKGLQHIVFERGKIGETWRFQRWDSFRLNSTNKHNLLPEQKVYFQDPDAFAPVTEFVLALESYAQQLHLPVKEQCNVVEVKKDTEQNLFAVTVSEGQNFKIYQSKKIVIASGVQNNISIPSFAKNISEEVIQFHTSEYKNAKQLPDGNVLVIGSAQSGTQIAEDLVLAKRKVFLSTGNTGRIPRRYRGRDTVDWLIEAGFYDVRTDDVTDPAILKMKPPQVSGVGRRGHTSSLQALAKSGAVILGRAENADAENIFLQPNAAAHVKFADKFSAEIKTTIDDYICKNNLPAPNAEIDINDLPDEDATCATDITKLSLKENNVNSIIWTTGFSGDFNYLKLPVLNPEKIPIHHNGISEVDGLYFIGLPWLRKRKSAIIYGINDDAEFIANQIS
jgi:putative flavoprotein involved in K+ transport